MNQSKKRSPSLSNAIDRVNDPQLNEQIMQSVVISSSGCWEWQRAAIASGYGRLMYRGRNLLAHRLSYAAFKGEIKTSQYVCHHCDNPPCVNPDHLFLGNSADNMNDASAKGRLWNQNDRERAAMLLNNVRGYGEKNGWSKLKNEQVVDIKKTGVTGRGGNVSALAKKYNVSNHTVLNILNGNLWKRVTSEL